MKANEDELACAILKIYTDYLGYDWLIQDTEILKQEFYSGIILPQKNCVESP